MFRATHAAVLTIALLSEFVGAQASWTYRSPSQSPSARGYAAATFDEAHGEALLLFGAGVGGLINDFWGWDGVNWQSISSPLPPLRSGHRMVWDSARQRVLMFGGLLFNTTTYPQDLWEWDGLQWSSRLPAGSPPGRSYTAMAFDPFRQVLVLFGGYAQPSTIFSDTWEWDGVHWNNRSPSVHPTARSGSSMAFDPINGSVLMYGGGSNGPLVETWSWDGTTWQTRSPATPPSLRGDVEMVTDTRRERIVLYGGNDYDMFPWEWDGAQWHQLYVASPGARRGHALVYDMARRETLFFGGSDPSSGLVADTWTYATNMPADAVAYGGGCAGGSGTLVLTNAPYSLPWIGDTLHMRVSPLAPTTTTVLFGTGLDPTAPVDLSQYGMPGCNGLVSVLIVDFVAASSGSADWSIAVPNTVALAGAHVFQQAFALEAGANAAGVVASNGADMMIGIR